VTLPGCQQYVWCSAGAEVTRFDCAAGTLYSGAGCTWADQVDCKVTRRPSRSPTPSPTHVPTEAPTEVPTELDIDQRVVYYPDFGVGVCRGQEPGAPQRFPSGVDRSYLFVSHDKCCAAYFPTNLEACESADVPTPSPVPAGEAEWFPDTNNNRCVNDVAHYPGDWLPKFYTFEECCGFPWLDEVQCQRQRPVVVYYPDYDNNTCKSDGRHSPYEQNLFESREMCCRFDWIDYGLCITGGSGPKEVQQHSSEYNTNPDEGLTGMEYYPDYTNNVCHCDGKEGQFEINIFTSYDACCQFTLIDTSVCRQYRHHQEHKCVSPARPPPASPRPLSPDPTWYPDMAEGLCRNDGRGPGRVTLAPSLAECCRRFMSAHQRGCEDRSQRSQMAAAAAAGAVCRDYGNRKRCVKQDGCEWNPDGEHCHKVGAMDAPMPSPTPRPTRRTISLNAGQFSPVSLFDDNDFEKCSDQTNKKQCAKVGHCRWDAGANWCSETTVAPLQTTPKSASTGTPSPMTIPVSKSTQRCHLPTHIRPNKKQCAKIDHCEWDRETEECFEVMPNPMPPQVTPHKASSSMTARKCAQQEEDKCPTVSDCQWDKDKWPRGQCVPRAMVTNSGSISQSAVTPPAAADMCGNKNKKQCAKAPDLCLYDYSWQRCRPLVLLSNMYYPDYFNGLCQRDNKYHGMDVDQLYDTAAACCRNPWIIDYVVCMTDMGEDAFADNP